MVYGPVKHFESVFEDPQFRSSQPSDFLFWFPQRCTDRIRALLDRFQTERTRFGPLEQVERSPLNGGTVIRKLLIQEWHFSCWLSRILRSQPAPIRPVRNPLLFFVGPLWISRNDPDQQETSRSIRSGTHWSQIAKKHVFLSSVTGSNHPSITQLGYRTVSQRFPTYLMRFGAPMDTVVHQKSSEVFSQRCRSLNWV